MRRGPRPGGSGWSRPRIRRPRRRLWPVFALLGVLSLGLTLLLGLRAPGSGRVPAPDEPGTVTQATTAPPLVGRTLAGDPFDLAALRGGVVLVNVFASWCGPCRTELPLLAAADRRWSAQGLHVVGLDVRDGPEAARALLDETGAGALPVVPDTSGIIAVNWGVRGVPETFLVDRDGRVRLWARGPVTAEWLERRLPVLLAS